MEGQKLVNLLDDVARTEIVTGERPPVKQGAEYPAHRARHVALGVQMPELMSPLDQCKASRELGWIAEPTEQPFVGRPILHHDAAVM